jgi:hypothetical protein
VRYEYRFYIGSWEDSTSTVSTDAPLPHIQVGHRLSLELPDLSTKAGYYWEIRDVEVYAHQPPNGALERVMIRVMIREQARSPER